MPVFPWPEICCSRFTFSLSDIFRRKEYRGTKLLRAVTHRHVNCVKRLIDEGADVNTVNEYGVSSLMIAATHGYIECLSILIEAGAEVEIVTHKKTKTSLIKSGTDTNRKQSSGKTALMRAANRGYSQCVEALVKAGADVNVVLEDGYTALMEATFGGCVKCVELLIDAGADVNMTNKHGKAAISLLPRHWYKSNIVEMLIRAGADVNAPDLYDFPQILSVAAKGTCEQLKFVIESGADVNAVDSHNNTALIAAVEQNVKHEGRSCLRVLLQAEAKINIVNNDHHNALSEHLRKQYQPDDNICSASLCCRRNSEQGK